MPPRIILVRRPSAAHRGGHLSSGTGVSGHNIISANMDLRYQIGKFGVSLTEIPSRNALNPDDSPRYPGPTTPQRSALDGDTPGTCPGSRRASRASADYQQVISGRRRRNFRRSAG